MPQRIGRSCRVKECPQLAERGGLCREHRLAAERQYDQARNPRREASRQVYRSRQWRRVRAFVLMRDPVCVRCRRRPSTEVNHKRRISEGGDPFDPTQLEGMCKPCHSSVTAGQVGFGGRPNRGDQGSIDAS